MIKNPLDNYMSLGKMRKNASELMFDARAFILHVISNRFLLATKLRECKRIHFGAGDDMKHDFVNIDLSGYADISVDARNGLNIRSNSIEYIYSSHFLEHLEHDELVGHLRECRRILQEGAVLRLGVPDFEKAFRYYCNHNDDRLEELRSTLSSRLSVPEKLICRMDWINRVVHEYGQHKTCLDWQKTRNLLLLVGFDENKIVRTEFQKDIDRASRKDWTFYVEATK